MIVYGGVKYFRVRHAIICKSCTQEIESKGPRDYVTCACGAVAVDGGVDGRIIGSGTFEDRSVYRSLNGLFLPPNAYIRTSSESNPEQ